MNQDQKNMLIANLYAPMFDYIEKLVETEKARRIEMYKLYKKQKLFGFLPWIGKRPSDFNSGYGLASDLKVAAIYEYTAKAVFEARVERILNAYLEGKVQPSTLPDSMPVVEQAANK